MILCLLNAHFSVGVAGGLSVNNKLVTRKDDKAKWEAVTGLKGTAVEANATQTAKDELKVFLQKDDSYANAGKKVAADVLTVDEALLKDDAAKAAYKAAVKKVTEAEEKTKQTLFDRKNIHAEVNAGYTHRMGSFFVKPELVVGMGFGNEQKGGEGVVSSSFYGQFNVKPGYSFGSVDAYGIVGFRMVKSSVTLGGEDFIKGTPGQKGHTDSYFPMSVVAGAGVSYAVVSNIAVKLDATYGIGLGSNKLVEQEYEADKKLKAGDVSKTKEVAFSGDMKVVAGVDYSF